MSDPVAGPPSAQEFRALIDDLLEEGERLKKRAQEPPPDLRALLGMDATGGVTITRDATGLIDGISFSHVDGRRADGELLLQQLNLALFTGVRLPLRGRIVTEEGDLAPALLTFMESVAGGELPEPVLFRNDLKTVTVGALNGEVVSIDCAASFLQAASDETLAAEIIRVAREAALATDTLGTHTGGTA